MVTLLTGLVFLCYLLQCFLANQGLKIRDCLGTSVGALNA